MAKGEVEVSGVPSPEVIGVDWELTNTVSPSAAGLSSEGYGQLSATAQPGVDDEFVIDRDVTVTFSKDEPDVDTNEPLSFGSVEGWVSGYSTYGLVQDDLTPETRGPASITITPNLAILNVDRDAPAVVNVSLSEVFQTYVGLVTSSLPVAYEATENPVVSVPGWTGNVWEYISNLAAIKGVELSYTGNGLVVRDIQVEALEQEFMGDPSYQFNAGSSGRYVEVAYQDQTVITSIEANLTNFSQNPKLGVNSTGWSGSASGGSSGSVTVGRITSPETAYQSSFTGPPRTGSDIFTLAWSLVQTHNIPITPVVTPLRMSIGLHLGPLAYSGGSIGSVRRSVEITFRDGEGGTILGSLGPFEVSTGSGVTPWSTVSDMPVGTSLIQITSGALIQSVSGSSSRTVSTYATRAWAIPGSGGNYFDGDMPGATWVGTPENSVSEMPNPNNIPLYDAFLDNNRILEVAAGEVQQFVLESNVWATSLLQPIPSLLAPVGVGNYHVIDSQGVPCTGAFVGLGGDVTVAINDLGQIVATLTGPSSEASINGGPYRLASFDGQTTRGEFRIAGTGIITSQKTVRVPTGADPTRFAEDVAYSITYPFVNTPAEAYTVGFATGAYASAAYPEVGFNFYTDGMPAWNYAAGKFFDYNGSRFRILSASVNPGFTGVSAQQRNTWGEVKSVHSGKTYGDLAAEWGSLRYRDTLIKPRKEV